MTDTRKPSVKTNVTSATATPSTTGNVPAGTSASTKKAGVNPAHDKAVTKRADEAKAEVAKKTAAKPAAEKKATARAVVAKSTGAKKPAVAKANAAAKADPVKKTADAKTTTAKTTGRKTAAAKSETAKTAATKTAGAKATTAKAAAKKAATTKTDASKKTTATKRASAKSAPTAKKTAEKKPSAKTVAKKSEIEKVTEKNPEVAQKPENVVKPDVKLTEAKDSRPAPGVLIAAAECAPLIKVGGLADVVGALPKYLGALGFDARVIMPFHREIKQRYAAEAEHIADFQASLGWRSQFVGVEKLVIDGVTYYFIDNEFYFGGPIYCGGEFEGEQYAFFTRAVMDAMPLLDFDVRILHCNDWHTAMMPLLAKTQYQGGMQERLRTVLTIHNLHFQGQFSHEFDRDLLRIDDAFATPQFIGHYGCDNMLKAGIVFSDKVTTVSPTYAREICEPFAGESLDGVLRSRGGDLIGILNGIDNNVWNPQTDKTLPANFDAKNVEGKTKVRDALLQELGLEPAGENTAVIGMVGRLTPQKGVDLVNFVIDELMAEDVRVIILGAGYNAYEESLRNAEWRHKGRLCSYIGYNADLSHRIYAGSDLFLMPSLFEPCGISQMIAMRYGTLPIVRETGGLVDTVIPYNEFTGEGNGFSFANYDAGEMLNVIRWAINVWRNGDVRKRLVNQAMNTDYGFERCARSYADLYQGLL